MAELIGVLIDIAEATDEVVAVKLATEFGGTHINIPKNPNENSKLAKIIGLDNLKKLVKEFGYGEILIPMGGFRGAKARRANAVKMLEDGVPHTKIAKDLDLHVRTVERIAATLRRKNKPILDFLNKLDEAS